MKARELYAACVVGMAIIEGHTRNLLSVLQFDDILSLVELPSPIPSPCPRKLVSPEIISGKGNSIREYVKDSVVFCTIV